MIHKDDKGNSRECGFVTFNQGQKAKEAMAKLNGMEIAGREMKVSFVNEAQELIIVKCLYSTIGLFVVVWLKYLSNFKDFLHFILICKWTSITNNHRTIMEDG
eukprot:TRINITY_DN311_c0_g1_i1.p1 TRINITY_DN311_c0_g1~~TRINITY_DN311_c0_g1_i1.p1  ORF type:complete len:103 (-),score=16.66 TRINITY_DN311_c0_g1_i1:206-514(-)